MGILGIWYTFIAFVVLVGVSGAMIMARGEDVPPCDDDDAARRRARRGVLILALALTGCASVTVAWQEVAVAYFAECAGGETRGMVIQPVGGGDHEFTENGAHFHRWIFEIPLGAGLSTLILTAIAGGCVLYWRGHRRKLVGVGLWAFAMGAIVFIAAAYRWFDVVEIFI